MCTSKLSRVSCVCVCVRVSVCVHIFNSEHNFEPFRRAVVNRRSPEMIALSTSQWQWESRRAITATRETQTDRQTQKVRERERACFIHQASSSLPCSHHQKNENEISRCVLRPRRTRHQPSAGARHRHRRRHPIHSQSVHSSRTGLVKRASR